MFPQYAEEDGPYALLARAYAVRGMKAEAAAELAKNDLLLAVLHAPLHALFFPFVKHLHDRLSFRRFQCRQFLRHPGLLRRSQL